jgi:hypothetical protein
MVRSTNSNGRSKACKKAKRMLRYENGQFAFAIQIVERAAPHEEEMKEQQQESPLLLQAVWDRPEQAQEELEEAKEGPSTPNPEKDQEEREEQGLEAESEEKEEVQVQEELPQQGLEFGHEEYHDRFPPSRARVRLLASKRLCIENIRHDERRFDFLVYWIVVATWLFLVWFLCL